MGILRSEPMRHGTLIIPADRAVEIVTLLGSKGVLQIQDMNAQSMHRPYRRYIQRIEEMERMLRYLTDEIHGLPGATIVTGEVDAFLASDTFALDGVEESLQTLYAQFVKFRENNEDLLRQRDRALMEQAVARVAAQSVGRSQPQQMLTGEAEGQATLLDANDPELGGNYFLSGFSTFAGVVNQMDQEKLARTIFRATRGNAYTHSEPLQSEADQDAKNVFVVYYQGGQGSALHEKISKIAKAFGVEVFDWPHNVEEAIRIVDELQFVIQDKAQALGAFEEFFFDEVAVLLEQMRPGGNSLIEDWRLFCVKQKAIYACLNYFEETESTLRADCWFPAAEEEPTRQFLSGFSGPNQVSAFLLSDRETYRYSDNALQPPTYIKTTGFSEAFQNIVDTFGVPRYQEANPALLTTITFPYLFGIMYGDIGHGGIVMCFGLYLVLHYSKLCRVSDELVQMIAYGRYMILLMGCFALYHGFLYNDFFSLGVDIFGSRYKMNESRLDGDEYIPDENKTAPYPFGFDPAWKGAVNELDFMNSFKMKFSVIVGFIHMLSGVFLKGMNSLHFKDHLTFYFEFIPQLIFLIALIGYMDFLILLKWTQDASHNKPSIISSIIGMCMLKSVDPAEEMYANQETVQKILLLIIVLTVPIMLLPKPLLLLAAHKRGDKKSHSDLERRRESLSSVRSPPEETQPLQLQTGQRTDLFNQTLPPDGANLDNASKTITRDSELGTHIRQSQSLVNPPLAQHAEFDFGEIMIHQMIETIEYVLGVISNTASYLRLWALSLAHQQLALVFFENIILNVLNATVEEDGNIWVPGISMFLAFAFFACITFGIMLCMDSLECFLHALRLQWVEFQNKFYKADGYRFTPFSFQQILQGTVSM